MRRQDEIEAELRAMMAARLNAGQGSMLESWVNGAIFTLSWMKSDLGSIPPSEGFSRLMAARPESPPPPRKDPALPGS